LVRSQHTDNTQVDGVAVGVILGTWGLDGHVKVRRFGNSNVFFKSGFLFNNNDSQLIVQSARTKSEQQRDVLIVKFKSVKTVAEAISLKGTELKVSASKLKDLPEWTYYHHELIGLNVLSVNGDHIGILTKIIETGANDVYLVSSPKGTEILFPAIRDVIIEVNINKKILIIESQDTI